MVIFSERPDLCVLDRANIPLRFRQELSCIEANPWVTGSVNISELKDNKGKVYFLVFINVKRNIPSRHQNLNIKEVEPLVLVYNKESLGRIAPEIYSDRRDFPRDLPRLYPVHEECPASLCISREGLTKHYLMHGIEGVLRRIADWLFDAACGTLDYDGWEPWAINSCFFATLDGGRFQKIAYQKANKHNFSAYGAAKVVFTSRDDKVVNCYFDVDSKILKHAELDSSLKQPVNGKSDPETKKLPIPWVFNYSDRNQKYSQRSVRIDNISTLLSFAEKIGIGISLKGNLESLKKLGKKYSDCLVIIGIWRPKPLIPDIPGLSDIDEERCLELCAYYVQINNQKVRPVRVVSKPNEILFAKAGGQKVINEHITLLGCGALGSKIAEHLVREGISRITLIDHDYLEPHNLARHILDSRSLGLRKTKEIKQRLEWINPNLKCKVVNLQVARNNKNECRKELKKSGYIINASADEKSLRTLTRVDIEKPLLLFEIVSNGQLSLSLSEGEGRNPRIDDVFAWLYYQANTESWIKSWLENERGAQNNVGVFTGIGCASATTILPDATVALHAASTLPVIRRHIKGQHIGRISLNKVSEDGVTEGSQFIEVPKFKNFRAKVINASFGAWNVRVANIVLKHVDLKTCSTSPIETGGYLFGRTDINNKTIHIVDASVPNPIDSSVGGIELPSVGTINTECNILKNCYPWLDVIGTWHSHTNGDVRLSKVDIEQCKKISNSNKNKPMPFVVAITSKQKFVPYIVFPESWCISSGRE